MKVRTDLDAVASVLKALSTSFPHYALYAPNQVDLIIVASPRSLPAFPGVASLSKQPVRSELERIGVRSAHDLTVRLRRPAPVQRDPDRRPRGVAADREVERLVVEAPLVAHHERADDAVERRGRVGLPRSRLREVADPLRRHGRPFQGRVFRRRIGPDPPVLYRRHQFFRRDRIQSLRLSFDRPVWLRRHSILFARVFCRRIHHRQGEFH